MVDRIAVGSRSSGPEARNCGIASTRSKIRHSPLVDGRTTDRQPRWCTGASQPRARPQWRSNLFPAPNTQAPLLNYAAGSLPLERAEVAQSRVGEVPISPNARPQRPVVRQGANSREGLKHPWRVRNGRVGRGHSAGSNPILLRARGYLGHFLHADRRSVSPPAYWHERVSLAQPLGPKRLQARNTHR